MKKEDFNDIEKNRIVRDGVGLLAQVAEHLPFKQGVTGSSPVRPTPINFLNRDLSQEREVFRE